MAINVKFGTCSCENEVVNKHDFVTLGDDVSCEMVNTDILNPILRVNARINKNYCQISSFGGRYYYIETVEGIAGGHCLCHCHVDVLYSYCDSIKALECLVLRNEDINKWKRDYTDRAIPASNMRVTFGREFGTDIVNGGTLQEFLIGVI